MSMTAVTNTNKPTLLTAALPPTLKLDSAWGVYGLTVVEPQADEAGDAAGEGLADGAIVIKNGTILDLGTSVVLRARYPQIDWQNGTGFTIFPGLINSHTHAAMGFFRGLGHGHAQMIESFLFPAERALTPELLEPLSYSYILSGLRAGVTCFVDHYYFAAGVANALDRLGMRGVVGETCADLGGAFPDRAAFKRWQQHIERWPHSSRLTPAIAPHAADTVSADFLQEMAAFATARKLPLHLHLAQTTGERQRVLSRAGCSPVAYAARAGALTPSTLAVHLVAIDREDLRILADHGVTAGYCPASQIIYEQLAPIAELMQQKIPIALGTDCAASNDSADLLAELKFAALLAKDRQIPTAARCVSALWQQVTTIPARVIGLGENIGRLAPGYAADIVFAAQTIGGEPLLRPLTNLIFSTGSRDIRHVMIDGRFVLWQGEPCRVTTKDLTESYQQAVQTIRSRLPDKLVNTGD